MDMLAAWRACRTRLSPNMRLARPEDMPTTQRWTSQCRNEVNIHFRQAAATLLGPTIAHYNPQLYDIVSWALVRWLFVDDTDDRAHPDGDDDEDVKDKKQALCVLGPGLLLEPSIIRAQGCPLPELCGDLNPPPVVALFTLEFVAAQKQRHQEHRARQLRQCEERVMAVARRLWARVLTAAREQPHEGSNAVAVVVLLRGISLMFRVLQKAGAASDGECVVFHLLCVCGGVPRVCRACVRACVSCLRASV